MEFLFKYIARQFSNPQGFGGKISTFAMNCLNRKLYDAVVENLDIRETDAILDIGFGNGYLMRKLSSENFQKLYGIEISQDMLHLASKKNRKKIDEGKIRLLFADVLDLPFEDSSIDKAYTVNTVYFWNDLQKGFSEIKRILKPGGIFVNALYMKEWLDKLPMTRYGFSKFTVEEIEKITRENDLIIERIIEVERSKSVCVVARKEIINNRKIEIK